MFARNTLAAAFVAAALPVAAVATTVDITSPTVVSGILDGGTYAPALNWGDVVSGSVNTVAGDLDVAIDFSMAFLPSDALAEVRLTGIESDVYGEVTVELWSGASMIGSSVAGDNGGAFFSIASATVVDNPFTLKIDWTTSKVANFNFDMAISAVPAPAAGFLLLGGLGALAARKRRKS